MLVNAADDPLVHESLLTIPKSLSGKCFFLLLLSHSADGHNYSVPFTVLSAPHGALIQTGLIVLGCGGAWAERSRVLSWCRRRAHRLYPWTRAGSPAALRLSQSYGSIKSVSLT